MHSKHELRRAAHSFSRPRGKPRCLINAAPCRTGAAFPRRATARGCCDTVPALTPCGLESTKTNRRSQQCRKAAQQCRRTATEIREVLERHRLDLDRVRSLWQQDRVAVIQKSLRKRSVSTGSTLSLSPRIFDVDLNLGNCVAADSGLQDFSGTSFEPQHACRGDCIVFISKTWSMCILSHKAHTQNCESGVLRGSVCSLQTSVHLPSFYFSFFWPLPTSAEKPTSCDT